MPRIVGEDRAAPVYRAVGVVEAVIALALLAPPVWTVEAIAAAALAVGFTGYLIYARIVVPEASCGCVGASAKSEVALTIQLPEAILFVMLSAELDRYWLLRSDIHDYWDDEDWRFVSYTATYDGRPATAVFAVPHHDSTPESVRVAVVDEASGQALYRPTVLATAG